MDAAIRLEPFVTEPLSWDEICRRYPDQYVCLVERETVAPGSPEITTARVVGHGPAHEAAFDHARDLLARYPRFAVRFTGVCEPSLVRPTLVIDDEALEILREPATFRFAAPR
jgi:hypothetical protein